jgi:hypothetical protein
MAESTTLSGKALLIYILANRTAILATSEENINCDMRELMAQQLTSGEKLLGFELAWDVHWDCVGLEDHRFINTDDELAQAPETTFWLREDGTLSRGADDVAALRQAIRDFLEDFIETLREETR